MNSYSCNLHKYYGLALLIVWMSAYTLKAQQINYKQPPNSSYLAEYGLSPEIFNVVVSPMFQEEYLFKAKFSVSELRGDEKAKAEYEVLYDPFYEYGLTMKLIVHDPDVYDLTKRTTLKKYVGKSNEKYKKIRGNNLVDESDVGLIKDNGEEVILGFRLKKSNLPINLKHLQHMDGEVYLYNGELQRIELILHKPSKIMGIDALEGSLVVQFQRMETGGYLLRESVEKYSGTSKNEAVELMDVMEFSAYFDREGRALKSYTSDVQINQNPDYTSDTLNVKLERALPLLGNAARKAGYELPLPYGVELFTHFQQEELVLEKIVLNGEDLTNSILEPGRSSARAVTNLIAAKADVWILPFFNVSVLGGTIFGTTDVKLRLNDEIRPIVDPDGELGENLVITTDITGPMFGAGITVAGGYKSFFATVNVMYIKQMVKEANTEVDAMTITPLVGVRFPHVINVVVGGQYQLYDSKVSGSLAGLNYEVELKATQWNWLLGLQRDFSNHWNATIMVGPNPRPQTTVVVGYRF
jgi:hypothetical protein